jgi:hypothetical protein
MGTIRTDRLPSRDIAHSIDQSALASEDNSKLDNGEGGSLASVGGRCELVCECGKMEVCGWASRLQSADNKIDLGHSISRRRV